MLKVKVSGITCEQDAVWSANLGIDYISFSLVKDDPQKISLSKCREIISLLPTYTVPIVKVDNEKDLFNIANLVHSLVKPCIGIEIDFPVSNEAITNIKDKYASKLIFMKPQVINNDNIVRPDNIDMYDFVNISGAGLMNLSEYIKIIKTSLFFSYESLIFDDTDVKKAKEAISEIAVYGIDINKCVSRTPRKKDYNKLKEILNDIQNIN